ncbi:MAG: isocitrate dehydrogenase (NAD+) [Planctomycetota bacterium]|jgi:isocitrate dehydrogenase (NAD+)
MNTYTVLELCGDGISSELARSVRALATSLPIEIEFRSIDISLGNRNKVGNVIYDEIMDSVHELGVVMKYPTATEGESPNRVLRDRCAFQVIHRPVMTFEGVQTNFTRNLDLDVVRVATGGTYMDRGRRIGSESAVSLRIIERGPSIQAARFAFDLATTLDANVVSTSKYTIQKEADGLFEECVEEISKNYPTIEYRRELFDALLGGIILNPDRYRVVVCPNEYGDFLSDMACGLIGSIGLGDSASYALNKQGKVEVAMFDPSGGTAPDIAGKNLCNPTAALLAFSSLLRHLGEIDTAKVVRRSIKESIAQGDKTRDIGGSMNTDEFTKAVCERVAAQLAPA